LSFQVEEARPLLYAASPTLVFKLRVANDEAAEPIHSILLRCQIMLEVTRRRYSQGEQERLLDLFGAPEQWSRTLRSMLWTNTSMAVPSFAGSTVVDLLVPCSFDFNVAATKYFAGLEGDQVPLLLLFSGTIFYQAENGALQVVQIPWEKETDYRLPVKVWREMMEHYYPNTAWLCLRRDVFERLYRYRVRHGLPTWEQTLENIFQQAGADTEPESEFDFDFDGSEASVQNGGEPDEGTVRG